MKLTKQDIESIAREAGDAGATVREYEAWAGCHYIGVVGDAGEFQSTLAGLREFYPETEAKLGAWKCDGVALSEVWYWSVDLEPDALERLFEIEEDGR